MQPECALTFLLKERHLQIKIYVLNSFTPFTLSTPPYYISLYQEILNDLSLFTLLKDEATLLNPHFYF